MAKRTSKKREKLPAIIERYLQVLEQKVPRSDWPGIFRNDVKVNGGSGIVLEGERAVTRAIEKWHSSVARVAISMVRMIDYMEESLDGTGRRTIKVDFLVTALWVNPDQPGEIPIRVPVIAMYEIRDGCIDEIMERWPSGRLPPTPW